MKYLLTSKNLKELKFRQKYLFETFGLWFVNPKELTIPNSKYSFIVLESFPASIEKDICLIHGHNYEIESLFDQFKHQILEKDIYVISCKSQTRNGYIIKGKRVYLSKILEHYNFPLEGAEFGFEFDITETELNLYNSKEKDFRKKLNDCFELLKKV